jgi:hypothetical protein
MLSKDWGIIPLQKFKLKPVRQVKAIKTCEPRSAMKQAGLASGLSRSTN